jgi:hypothetical protein
MGAHSRRLALNIGRLMLLIAAVASGLAAVGSYLRQSHSAIQYNNHRTQWCVEVEECFLGGLLAVLGAAVLVESVRRRGPAATASIGRWTICIAFLFMVLKLAEAVGHDVAMSLREEGRISTETAVALLPNPSNWGYGLVKALPVALAGTWVMFLAAGRPMDTRVDSIEWIGRVVGAVCFLSWIAAFCFA